MRTLNLFLLFFFLFGLNSYSLPKCEGDDPTKWNNCEGTVNLEGGNKYSGELRSGVTFHGQGTYTWADGQKYVGEWKNGAINGQGTLTWADGSKYVGEWKDFKRHGQGTYTSTKGIRSEGPWVEDEFKGEKKAGGEKKADGVFTPQQMKNISYFYLTYHLQSQYCDEYVSSNRLKKLNKKLIEKMLDETEEKGKKFDRNATKDALFKIALEDSKDSANGLVFSYNILMAAGGNKMRDGCREFLKMHVEQTEMYLNAYKQKEKKNKFKKEKRDF
jgi:hypothetical protein